MTQPALQGLGGSAWSRTGGLGLFLVGWGWNQAVEMGTQGGEEPRFSSQESPRDESANLRQ